MNRARPTGLVILAGVGLYLAGILLPYARFHLGHPPPGFPNVGIQSVHALEFGGAGQSWNAATPLALMLVVTVAALVVMRGGRTATIAGGLAAGIGLELFLFFLGRVVATLYPRLGFAAKISAGPGAYLAPLGAFLLVACGVIIWRGIEAPALPRAPGAAVPALLSGAGLFAAAYFTSPGAGFPATLRWSSEALRWNDSTLWITLSVLVVVAGALWLSLGAAGPDRWLAGLAGGFGLFGLLHFGDALGEYVTVGYGPGPQLYLGLAGSLVLLVGAALILVRRGGRTTDDAIAAEAAAPSP